VWTNPLSDYFDMGVFDPRFESSPVSKSHAYVVNCGAFTGW